MAIRDEVYVDLITETKESVKSMARYAAAIGAAVVAVRRIARAVGEMMQAYEAQLLAETKLASAIRSTGGAVGITLGQMKDMASALQQVTTYGDESIIAAQGLLVTFTKIGQDVFPKALEAALDMSTMFGQDLQQSVIQLGTALNDPIMGIGRLRRIGISFTEEQKDLIKTLVEEGRTMEAQQVILNELQVEFGGVARAAGDTAVGAMKQLKNAMSDLKEEGGRTITNTLAPLAEKLTEIARQAKATYEQMNLVMEALNEPAPETADEIRRQMTALQDRIEEVNTGLDKGVRILGMTRGEAEKYVVELQNRLEGLRRTLITMGKDARSTTEEDIIDPFAEAAEVARTKLAREFQRLDMVALALGENFDVNKEKIKALEETITELVDQGLHPTWPAMQQLIMQLANLRGGAEEFTDIWSGLNVEFLETLGILPQFNNEFLRLTGIVQDFEDLLGETVPMTEDQVEAYIKQQETQQNVARVMQEQLELEEALRESAAELTVEIERQAEAAAKAAAEREELNRALWQSTSQVVGSLGQIWNNYYEGLLQNEELTDEQRRAIMRKQAQAEKRFALFQIAINTARAIVESLPRLGLVALAITTGAAQAAAVASQPLPALQEGGVVTRETVARVAEKEPELIIPLSKLGSQGAGMPQSITNVLYIDGRVFARLITQLTRDKKAIIYKGAVR